MEVTCEEMRLPEQPGVRGHILPLLRAQLELECAQQ